jgi:beta-lactamase regulating signal transducer with metallopeptidase domain
VRRRHTCSLPGVTSTLSLPKRAYAIWITMLVSLATKYFTRGLRETFASLRPTSSAHSNMSCTVFCERASVAKHET